jgi:ABC-type nitrate/sulfonate/bicarbonate transport system permease component
MSSPYHVLPATSRRVLGLSSVVIVLIVWTVVTSLELVSPAKLPSLMQVAEAFVRLCWDADRGESLLATATAYSVMRVAAAGVLVVLIGLPIGILMGASPRINAFLSPLIDPFRSAPVVALLPILVMWLGIGELMKVSFLFVGAVVFLIPMVRDAMLAVSQHHWIAARDLGATPWEAVWLAVVPMAKPRIADAVTTSVSVMWTYITVAEYVNARKGLGQLIQNARRFSAMDQVFVGIIVIIALALITYSTMSALKRKLYPWESE